MRAIPTILFTLVLSGLAPANAADSYPDLRGTWTGKGDGVFVTAPGSQTNARYGAVEIFLAILKQEDRRFSGTIKMDKETKPIVGVLTGNDGIW
jgi:hypothetical protein